MLHLADTDYRPTVNCRMFGLRSPHFPDRVSDSSVPNVDEILRRGETMPGRYLDDGRAITCPPSPMAPPLSPYNFGWPSGPLGSAFPKNEPPEDPHDLDFSKDDEKYMYSFQNNPPRGLADYGYPTAIRRNGSIIYSNSNLPNYTTINIPGGRAENGSPEPRRYGSPNNRRSTVSPIAPYRNGSPTETRRDYSNGFSQNHPGGPAMFNDMRAPPINPSDSHFRTQTWNQGRRPAHWSNYEDCSSGHDHGNRSPVLFDGSRSYQMCHGHRSSQNFDGNRSSSYLDDFNVYDSGNESGFIDDRPRYAAERHNLGHFGGSNNTNDDRIDHGYKHQLNPFQTFLPTMGRKRKREEKFDNWSAEKRICPEQTTKTPIFRIGGFILDYASPNAEWKELPQPEERSHAVRFFKRFPSYRIRSKKSKKPASFECYFIEDADKRDGDAFIRHTIAEEWKKAYRERNYRCWANWWNDFADCGQGIRKELERFHGLNVKKNFEPPEGPIDSEAYVRLANAALVENNITYLKNMRNIYRLVNFNVLGNLNAYVSGHLQDIIRFIPNHLWRYKMRSIIFVWSWYRKMVNCGNLDYESNQSIIHLWNNPILHWLAKKAFDEMTIISKIEYKAFKGVFPQGILKDHS